MYLTRLVLSPRSRLVRKDLADCQGLHRTIMRAFPEVSGEEARAQLGVLYRLEDDPRTGAISLYAQSEAEPDWSRLPPDYFVGQPECKPVAEAYGRIKEGMVLRYRLRVNPTRKIDTKTGPDGEKRNGRRVAVRGDDALLSWIERKATTGGFRLLDVVIHDSGLQARVAGDHPNGELRFQGVLFEGRLAVVDAELFRQTLRAGIGSAKAYGFGLLSVGPEMG
jgi:CRISPR system Cascade subunit CasE